MWHIHDWVWGEMKWKQSTYVQYAKCSKCGKIKVREVLL